MYYFKYILSWFIIGFICLLLGTLSDYIFHKRKPVKKLLFYIWPILFGYACVPILIKSIYYGIKFKLRK